MIDTIIQKYGLSDNDIIRKHIELVLRAEKEIIEGLLLSEEFFPIKVIDRDHINTLVFTDECLSYKYFPKQMNHVKVFIANYKRKVPLKSMGLAAPQYSKPLEKLRKNHGCVYERTGGKGDWTIKENGLTKRHLIGLDPTFKTLYDDKGYLQCNRKKLEEYEKEKECPISGKSKDIERDHRIPLEACRELGIMPATITNESIDDGTIENHFQWLSRENNLVKREACSGCLRGKKIKVLPMAQKKQKEGKFISKWCEDCTECYWYDVEKAFE